MPRFAAGQRREDLIRRARARSHDQHQISKILNLPLDDVEIALSASGGAFGAKEELSIQAQTALAAYSASAASEDSADAEAIDAASREAPPDDAAFDGRRGCRGPSAGGARADCGRRGRICGYKRQMLAARGLPLAADAYRVPNVDVESKAVYTNNPTSGAMRGFGSNQAQFAMEGAMDLLAEKVGVDGYEIRMRNILNPGDAFATGQIMRPKHDGAAAFARSGEGSCTRTRNMLGLAAASRARESGTAHRRRIHQDSRLEGPRRGNPGGLHGNGAGNLHHDPPGSVRGDGPARRRS